MPGIGKTRLVHELLGIVDDDEELIVWRQGRSLSYGGGVSYWALGEMVKAQAGILESDARTRPRRSSSARRSTCSTTTPSAPGSSGISDRSWDWRAASATSPPTRARPRGNVFEVLAEQNVTILVFDDLHWADDGLLDFVDRLVDEVAGVPLLVVCTARPELLERRPGWEEASGTPRPSRCPR